MTSSRVVTGVCVGMLLGFAFCMPWARAISGVPWVPGPVTEVLIDRWWFMQDSMRSALRLLAPFVLGGAAAGALVGAQLPRMQRVLGAFVVTSTAIALFLFTAGLAHPDDVPIDTEFLLYIAAASVFVGFPIGLFIRDVVFYTGAVHLVSGRKSTGRLMGAVLYVANRFPRLGGGWRQRRRERIRRQPFPAEWVQLLRSRLPAYSRLPLPDQEELQRQIMVFLAEKRIEGCGVEVTDGMRVTIAAHACLLTLRLDPDCYAKVRTILIYPRTFVPRRPDLSAHWPAESPVPTLGESWRAGVVVLSWKGVRQGVLDPDDGKNLVLHEFAHQLDQEDGSADGVPLLDPPLDYRTWTAVLQSEFRRLEAEAAAGMETVLDPYGATNPAELFAVATEAFFEKPQQLRDGHPELYEQLKQYYRQDPVTYLNENIDQAV